MPGGKGITVPEPLAAAADVKPLLAAAAAAAPNTAGTAAVLDVRVALAHVLDAVTSIRRELDGAVPLIGFSAAPWTLMYYMVGGTSKVNQRVAEDEWLANHPDESAELLDALTDVVIDYCSAQVEHGAQILQIFEAMGMQINDANFEAWCAPRLARIAAELKARHPDVPLIVFPRGASAAAIPAMAAAGYDVVTLDTANDRAKARGDLAAIDSGAGLQVGGWTTGAF